MGTIVEWPICAWCGDDRARKCPLCDKFTCSNCLVSLSDVCVHEKFEPIQTKDWSIDNALI